jgi:photosynthetic reaction center cytochrome c subunit
MRGWSLLLLLIIAAGVFMFFGPFQLPIVETVQRGYRGLGMAQVVYLPGLENEAAMNRVPEPIEPVEPSGTPSSEVYENVQVLGDVDADEFNRLMSAITEWVSPEQGCTYCHAEGEELSSDSLYTKVVARRMIQMTRHINAEWEKHVGNTGVTCYTCHRGKPVPANIWFYEEGPPMAEGLVGGATGQNRPAPSVGLASLPYDPFEPFLEHDNGIRVVSTENLPAGNRQSIKQTEWTYGLMMHMSNALGVNCTYCHNSRNFMAWDQSNPARASAWYGIRMVRDLNADYLEPLRPVFPHVRLGPLGDVAKVNCATCHQGAYKPLYGANMLQDYPELGGPAPAATVQ